jgi:hypothetical protein
MKIKKYIVSSLLVISFIFFLSCGGSSSNKSEDNEVSSTVAGAEDSSFSEIDTSLPLNEQLSKVFSSLEPNSSFYGSNTPTVTNQSPINRD